MKTKIIIILLLALGVLPLNRAFTFENHHSATSVKHPEPEEQAVIEFLREFVPKKYSSEVFDTYLYVSIKKQKMYHIVNNQIAHSYSIGGSKRGVGNKFGSLQTPVGLHTIAKKYGYEIPSGGLFVERKFTGKVCEIHDEKFCMGQDDVTTRILWLQGEEPGLNKGGDIDSYNRNIYIHGTPEEGLIGTPSSKGCLRMKNNEVKELFEYAFIGMKVLILDE